MGFKIKEDYKVVFFGKEFNWLQHIGMLFGYLMFLMIIWPMISRSYLFIPVAIVILPMILPEFIYYEFYQNDKFYKVLMYGGMLITTYVYTQFFLECSFLVSIMHFVVYAVFGYLRTKEMNL